MSIARRVYKYPLRLINEPQIIEVPTLQNNPGKVVLLGPDLSGQLCIWIEAWPDYPPQARRFVVKGTGHLLESLGQHVGSCVVKPFVWHVYEV